MQKKDTLFADLHLALKNSPFSAFLFSLMFTHMIYVTPPGAACMGKLGFQTSNNQFEIWIVKIKSRQSERIGPIFVYPIQSCLSVNGLTVTLFDVHVRTHTLAWR